MRNIFSINGTGILTIKDLQREFSPWSIYDALSDFVSFALIHSQPLPLKVCHQEDDELIWEDVTYFDKSFWVDILKVTHWPQESNYAKLMKLFAEEALLVKIGAKDKFAQDKNIGIDSEKKKEKCVNYVQESKDIIAEYDMLKIERKLQHIITTAKLSKSAKNAQIAVILLAICELSEINALEFSFSKPTVSSISRPADAKSSDAKPVVEKKENDVATNSPITHDIHTETPIAEFPSTKDISLVASDTPYKYWYHSSNKLENGEAIKTVCVHAKASSNKYTSVIIQLYDDVSKQCIHTLTLAPNEYRYCNVAGGKIIKFLHTIAMSADAYLYRKDLTQSDITVCGEGVTEWTLYEDNVSSFGIASNDGGFVLVQKGKLNTVFYKKANDYMTKMMMNLIIDPIVEIKLTEEGYIVLTSKGEVISDIPSFKTEQNVVSLDDFSRLPIPECNLCKTEEFTEISLGNKKDCLMIRAKSAKKNIVFYRSQRKRIIINGDIKNGIKISFE